MTSLTESDAHELRRLLDRALDLNEQYRRERDGLRVELNHLRSQVTELLQQQTQAKNRLTLSSDTILRQVTAQERTADALTKIAITLKDIAIVVSAPTATASPEAQRLAELCRVPYTVAAEALTRMDFYQAVEKFRTQRQIEDAAKASTLDGVVKAANIELPKIKPRVTKLVTPLAASVAQRLKARHGERSDSK